MVDEEYDENDLKSEKIVEQPRCSKPTISQRISTTLYHPELNPIELAWSVVKGYVAKHKSFTLMEVEKLVPEGISMVTPTLWEKFCRHTEKVEEE